VNFDIYSAFLKYQKRHVRKIFEIYTAIFLKFGFIKFDEAYMI